MSLIRHLMFIVERHKSRIEELQQLILLKRYDEALQLVEGTNYNSFYGVDLKSRWLFECCSLFLAMEQYDQALEYINRAKSILAGVSREFNPVLHINFLGLYAQTCVSLGEYERAVGLIYERITLLSGKFGSSSCWVANEYLSLGDIYMLAGQFNDAEMAFKRTLEILEATVRKESSSVADVLISLFHALHRQNKRKEMGSVLLRAVYIYRHASYRDSNKYAEALYYLGCFHNKDGNFDEAEGAFLQALVEARSPFFRKSDLPGKIRNRLEKIYKEQKHHRN